MNRSNMFQSIRFLLAIGLVAAAATPSYAVVLGPFAGSWDGTEPTQLGRINRNGVASDGTGSKTYPGDFNPGGTYRFETFQFYNNGPSDVVTINCTVDSTNTHFAAFLGTTYDTTFNNNGPNYLGDLGSSVTQPFSILAPANSAFLVVASTNNVGNNTGNFSFTVTGNNVSLSAPSAVPEPASIAILGLGAIGLAAYRRRRKVA